MDFRILNNFHKCKIKNILTSSINPGKATPPSKGKLSGSKICPAHLQHCRRKASQILTDPAHPSNRLLQLLLPSSQQYHSFGLQTTRLRNSFIPLTVRLLNFLAQTTENNTHMCTSEIPHQLDQFIFYPVPSYKAVWFALQYIE